MVTEISRVAKNCADRYVEAVPIEAFGRNIKRLRKAQTPILRGKDLAAAISTDPGVVSRWENGKGGLPETPTLIKLAKTLQVSVDELLAGVDVDYDEIIVTRSDISHGAQLAPNSTTGGPSDVGSSAASRRLVEQSLLTVEWLYDLADEVRRRGKDLSTAAGGVVPPPEPIQTQPAARDRRDHRSSGAAHKKRRQA
jgi:transcriptional regulator with XRE-family HTH domain